MADDIANLLHSSYGLPKTGKSAPMGSAKKGAPQAQAKFPQGKSAGPANSSPIVDDGFANGSMGSKSPSDYSIGEDPFFTGSGRAAGGAYGAGDDIFGMGVGGTSGGYASASSADPFMMGGSHSPGPRGGNSDPFGGLGQMGASSQTTYGSSDDLLGNAFTGKPSTSAADVSSQDPFEAMNSEPLFSTIPNPAAMPSPVPSFPSDHVDPFSMPTASSTRSPAPPPSSSNGHVAASGAFDDFGFKRTGSGGSARFGTSRESPASNHTPKESPQPSPRAGTFFHRSKKEEMPSEMKRQASDIPGEDAWLTVEDLLLSLVTQPTSGPPPSRPPPPPGTQRPRQPPPPPYQQVSQNPPPQQQPRPQPAAVKPEVPRDVPPSYAYAQQAPQSWPPPGNRRPSHPESQPAPPQPQTAAKEPDGMDFDAFASGRGARGSVTPPSEREGRAQDAEANAAAQAAASSSAQMAEAMARAKEKAEKVARAKAAKERERERDEARRAREEAAERLKKETQAKTQRAAETGFGGDSFNSTRRPDSEPRQRMPQPNFMSEPPRTSSAGNFSNIDDLGGLGVRKPAAAAPAQPPKATPSTASTANDWADILGGGGGGGASTPSDVFQEIEGESAERRDLRYQKWANINQRATEALAEKNRRDLEAQREQNERSRADDLYSHEIKRWAQGKEGNLIALISTLQHVLWPECGWEPIGLTDLITPPQVKKAYRKATLCVHPDKVQQKGANIHQKYIAEKVFDLLKEAWNKYNANTLF